MIILAFVLLFAGVQGSHVYAQKIGSPENSVNALDYRYQKVERSVVHFSDSIRFRNRFYNVFKGGMEVDWESTLNLNTPRIGFAGNLAFGYRISPVHAVELGVLYSNTGGRNAGGVDLDWAMNLNNFALRKDANSRFEVLFLAGASYRRAQNNSYGVNAGLRAQWNPGKNAGIFIEPRLNVLTDPYSPRPFITAPSLSFGLTLRYHKPDYYLWDYLTPFALKTNLLYDAMTGVNFGIEAPIGDRWSVAFDWVCPWWGGINTHRYLQLLNGNLEGRYWFGKRENMLQLTGWFAGVSVGGGLYDIMLNDSNGLQGEFSSCGAICGYAHPINASGTLRLEYALGLGWIGTSYVKYWWDGFDYSLVAPSPQSWKTDWYGPTKVQVSLVYMLKIRSKVSGRE